jgi:gliding motility-associated-like protein
MRTWGNLEAINLLYLIINAMKKQLLLACFFCFGILSIVYAQTPVLNWQTTIGGTRFDNFSAVAKTSDGGSIAVGAAESRNNDIKGNHGNTDALVVKFSSTGAKQWVKVFGGANLESFSSVLQEADGSYLAVGFAYSNDGDVSGNHGNTGSTADIWVVKISSSGVLLWQKCFGSASSEFGTSAIKSSDGNYVIAGVTYGNGGDVSGSHGDRDGWLIKISSTGTLLWQNNFGGTKSDVFQSLSETPDGGYIMLGTTSSNDGDVTGLHGTDAVASDMWVVKTDSGGNLAWQKCYGGASSSSFGNKVVCAPGGGYLVCGSILPVRAGISGDIAEVKGQYDIWIFKITVTGAITWQKTLGGTGEDICASAIATQDGGFMIGGATNSADGDVTARYGQHDIWLAKLNASGTLEWETSLGGSGGEAPNGLEQLNNGSYLVAGETASNDGQVTNQHGNASDAWLAKVTYGPIPVNDATLSVLMVSSGTLSPAFVKTTTAYNASVPASTTSITLTPTASNPASTIKVNGITVAGGTASAAIPLHAGNTIITTVVTAANGITTETYIVTIRRAASTNAVLSQILFNPAYQLIDITGTADYDRLVKVPKSVTSITVAATPQHAYATITINGMPVAAGVATSPIHIGGYDPAVIHIVVTAEDGITQKTYDLHIVRPSDNAFLSNLTTDPDYPRTETTGPADFNRVMTVPWHVTSMRFAATPQQATATIKINGSSTSVGTFSEPVSLSALTTVVNIVVTAGDGVTQKTYAITVHRNPSENAVLASITTNPQVSLTATTGPADYNRSASVSSGVSSITFAAVPQNSHASIKINGATVASGVASAPIALSTGPNTIDIVGTAEDGVTVKTYAITVTRAAPFMMASKNTGDGFPAIRPKEDREDTPTEQAGLSVRQGLSPNGDGINDRLAITGINAYPDNTVKVMNRNGDVIYQAKGYDNTNVAFDGRNSKGVLQQPGTYFYSVQYKQGSEVKRKTGYLVIKY